MHHQSSGKKNVCIIGYTICVFFFSQCKFLTYIFLFVFSLIGCTCPWHSEALEGAALRDVHKDWPNIQQSGFIRGFCVSISCIKPPKGPDSTLLWMTFVLPQSLLSIYLLACKWDVREMWYGNTTTQMPLPSMLWLQYFLQRCDRGCSLEDVHLRKFLINSPYFLPHIGENSRFPCMVIYFGRPAKCR